MSILKTLIPEPKACSATRLYAMFLVLPLFVSQSDVGQTIGPQTGFEGLASHVQSAIESEIDDKNLRSISIAIVDYQEIVWAQGFGVADPEARVAATAERVYRVGSVSKLFTDNRRDAAGRAW